MIAMVANVRNILFCILQVAYERVNLADIETSSEEDDYGDLFAHVSHPSCWKKYQDIINIETICQILRPILHFVTADDSV